MINQIKVVKFDTRFKVFHKDKIMENFKEFKKTI